MGSKRLKAVVVKSRRGAQVPIPDAEKLRELRSKYLKDKDKGMFDFFHDTGTIGLTSGAAQNGDSPVKNWGGAGPAVFNRGIENFRDQKVMPYQTKRYGCWRCSMACGGHMVVTEGEFAGVQHHKPEYETAAAYGTMTLNDDFPSLIKLNELCNRYGLDTISAGCTMSFVIECFENGVLTLEDTDGVPMTWGNYASMIEMTRKMGLREGFGDVIADGVKLAAERIGRGSERFAVHIHGQELPMHDPKFEPALATTYMLDATPARHTQGQEGLVAPGLDIKRGDKYVYTGKGDMHRKAAALLHVVNSAGICEFAYFTYNIGFVTDFMTAITGKDWNLAECIKAGERIGTLRHAFNLREGLNPLEWEVPPRMIGTPPLKEGNVRNVTVDIQTLMKEYLEAADWDTKTTRPSDKKLKELGLAFVARDI
jgi:aldehyde:ferredoxin oxidoreductase